MSDISKTGERKGDCPVVIDLSVREVCPTVVHDLLVSGARGSHAESHFLLVRVETDAGLTGIGEVSGTLLWSGEDAVTARHVIGRALRECIVGTALGAAEDLRAAEARMEFAVAGHPFTKAGISMALWDAYARSVSAPLVSVLGGSRRDAVKVKCSLSGNGARLERALRAAQVRGFQSFKIKVGMDLDADVARLRELRGLIGTEAFIGLDANGGYSFDDAQRALDRFLPYAPAFFEQPVAPRALDHMRALRHRGVPVVADESVFGPADLDAVIDADAADVVSLYVGKSGGPSRARAMATQAADAGLEVIIGSNGELGVGAAAQLHVACAAESLSDSIPSDVIGGRYYVTDVVERGIDSDGVTARLAPGAGLGVTLSPGIRDDGWSAP